MVVGVVAGEGSAMTASVVGGMMRERKRMLMSMGGGFCEGSVVEVRKGGSFGDLPSYRMNHWIIYSDLSCSCAL